MRDPFNARTETKTNNLQQSSITLREEIFAGRKFREFREFGHICENKFPF